MVELQARQIPAEGNAPAAPEWIVLLPAGQVIAGMDGRQYQSPGPEAVIAEQRRRDLMLPVDINHATHRNWNASPTPAYGWVVDFRDEAGEVQGRVEWTEAGLALLAARAYRYYSPAYEMSGQYDQRVVRAITSVALCTIPNLGARTQLNQREGGSMKGVARRLGLPEDATEQQIIEAIDRSRSAGPETNAGQMVPRADYDVVLQRAETAETAISQRDAADLERDAGAAFDAALKARKVAPASRDFYLARMKTRQEVQEFQAFAEASTEIVPAGDTAPTGAPDVKEDPPPEEVAVFTQLGIGIGQEGQE